MGTRVVRVSMQFLLELCKRQDDRARYYTLDNPLPDDARLIAVQHNAAEVAQGIIGLIVESAEWPKRERLEDALLEAAPRVTFRLHYLKGPGRREVAFSRN